MSNFVSFAVLALLWAGCSGDGDHEGGSGGGGGGDVPCVRGELDDGVVCTPSRDYDIDLVQAELDELIEDNDIDVLPPAPSVTDAMYTLGQALAFDKILSGEKNVSCLTCHHPTLGTGDGLHLPQGVGGDGLGPDRVGGEVIARHSQPLYNLDLFANLFWDGRVALDAMGNYVTPAGSHITPEMAAVFDRGYGIVAAQAMFPVTDPGEMRGPGNASDDNELGDIDGDDLTAIWQALMFRLGQYPQYVQMFQAAYPEVEMDQSDNLEDVFSFAHAANAIAAFEIRAFDLRNNRWQQYVGGDRSVLTEEEIRGAHFFYDIGCGKCHSGATTSDFEFHNVVMPQFGPGKGHGDDGTHDFGREGVTNDEADRYKFRTSPLFNIQLTSPYGHTGQFIDLRHHIRIYANFRFWIRTYGGGDELSVEGFLGMVPGHPEWFETLKDWIPIEELRERDDVVDDMYGQGTNLSAHLNLLEPFLDTLTDESALDLSHLIPTEVPSGLPIAD